MHGSGAGAVDGGGIPTTGCQLTWVGGGGASQDVSIVTRVTQTQHLVAGSRGAASCEEKP